MKTNKFIYIIYLFIITSLATIDQFSKEIILTYFNVGDSKTIIDGFFSLTYVQNYGAGFSIMQNARTTFLIITPICLELFIISLELFILYILNAFGILVYLRHSFSYIFFNPLFSKKATAHIM